MAMPPLPQPKDAVIIVARFIAGMLSAAIMSWTLTHFSLQGTDFEMLGVGSEVVKGGITGLVTGIIVEPRAAFLAVAGAIGGAVVTVRLALRTIKNAFTSPLPPEDKGP